jgi:transcriptional regulator with XRE-family HTH domain
MEIKDRIAMIMKQHQLTPSAFADRIGANRSSISHILSGRNRPGIDILEKIVHRFPDVNSYWLLTGLTNVNNSITNVRSEEITYNREDKASRDKTKSILKIVEYYSDETFKVFYPNEE